MCVCVCVCSTDSANVLFSPKLQNDFILRVDSSVYKVRENFFSIRQRHFLQCPGKYKEYEKLGVHVSNTN